MLNKEREWKNHLWTWKRKLQNNKNILKVSKDKEKLTNNKKSSLHSTFQQECEVTANHNSMSSKNTFQKRT